VKFCAVGCVHWTVETSRALILEAPETRRSRRREVAGHGRGRVFGTDRLLPFADTDMGVYATECFAYADAFLLGRTTYEIMHSHWPKMPDPNDVVATKLNTLPKHVVTRTLRSPSWPKTHIIVGDLKGAIEALKATPGRELQVHGSRELARTLHDLGLIDEYRLWIFPVVLGTGRRLFEGGSIPTAFELIDTKTTSRGVSIHSLMPRGAPTTSAVSK
jgi:dihydrofolate reductase